MQLETPLAVSFSGGRTSGLMLYKILQSGVDLDRVKVLFANTGKEAEPTLQFIHEIETRWCVPIVWLEYYRDLNSPLVVKRKNIGQHSFKQVNFHTADRDGRPFEQLVQVKADYRREVKGLGPILPNPAQRFCSGELKARTMERYLKSIGWDDYYCAVGLRADEPRRVHRLKAQSTSKIEYTFPLFSEGIVEADVHDFWRQQPFDLRLPHDPVLGTYQGNCDLCFLKRTDKLQRIIKDEPTRGEWWARMEETTGQTFRRDRPSIRQLMKLELPMICGDEDLGTCLCTD